jgi:sugar/nucleoside kinase (ribokinase family)
VRPDLISIGDVMIDVSAASEALKHGGDVHGEVRLRPGGAAANAAVWAGSTGASVRLHGRVGDDVAGSLVRGSLEERGVEASLAVDREARTGTLLVVREAEERSMVADPGANARLAPDDLPERLEAGAVLVSGYSLLHAGSSPAATAALERADADVVAVDAASWWLLEQYGAERFLSATAPASLLLANAVEARTLSGVDDPRRAAEALSRRYGTAAVKLGARGALLALKGSEILQQPSPAIREVDPTGAGDAFDGVLLTTLARGASPDAALQEACAAGARAAASAENWPER